MRKYVISFLGPILLLSLVGCTGTANTTEELSGNLTLDNGVVITSLVDYNDSGFSIDDSGEATWFGAGETSADNMNTKLAEMKALEGFYAEKYSVEGQGFTVEESVIGWRWVEYDEL